jgi:hypothetical protein
MTMVDLLATRTIDGVEYRVYLEQDDGAESPREFGDCHAGVIVAARNRDYAWPAEDGDKITANYVQHAMDDHSFQGVARWLRMFYGASTVLPLYSKGYDSRLSAGDASDTPDAGDYAGVTFDQPSTRETTGIPAEHMTEALSVDVDEYSRWAVGEVYGYVIERRPTTEPHPDCHAIHVHDVDEWEHVDSLWGLIGDDYAEQEARRALAEL